MLTILNSSRGYITHEDAVNHTQFWHDYISTDLKHRFSAQLRNPVLRDSVLTSLPLSGYCFGTLQQQCFIG